MQEVPDPGGAGLGEGKQAFTVFVKADIPGPLHELEKDRRGRIGQVPDAHAILGRRCDARAVKAENSLLYYTLTGKSPQEFTFLIKTLLDNPIFEDKFLCAVGKTEWEHMRWTRGIAEKKSVINSTALVFTAAESPAQWRSAKKGLTSAGVNDRLLDCSDAHAFSSSGNKDRIGNCFTWIKADATFDGLRQSLNEPEDRIFIGDEPEQLQRVRENRTKYISSVGIAKAPGSKLSEDWFNFTLPLNHGLVAIIGNRGMGKSALTDTLAILGESHSSKFSFLDQRHFRNPKDNPPGSLVQS